VNIHSSKSQSLSEGRINAPWVAKANPHLTATGVDLRAFEALSSNPESESSGKVSLTGDRAAEKMPRFVILSEAKNLSSNLTMRKETRRDSSLRSE
jgi:hypothetical protein